MTMDERRESGFINSQPSIAEFMTMVPHINEPLRSPSITGDDSSMRSFCQNFNGSHPPGRTLTPQDDPRVIAGDPGQRDTAGVKFPDYPWMKEKKPVRKATVPPPGPNDIGIIIFNAYRTFLLSLNYNIK